MAMGPLYLYRDDADLERLLAAVRDTGIRVTPDPTSAQSFWFRCGLGRVHGGPSGDAGQRAVYFGFGHPFNPLLWAADAKLLRRIEAVFQANGSRRLTVEEVA